jgi:hypothetical protein
MSSTSTVTDMVLFAASTALQTGLPGGAVARSASAALKAVFPHAFIPRSPACASTHEQDDEGAFMLKPAVSAAAQVMDHVLLSIFIKEEMPGWLADQLPAKAQLAYLSLHDGVPTVEPTPEDLIEQEATSVQEGNRPLTIAGSGAVSMEGHDVCPSSQQGQSDVRLDIGQGIELRRQLQAPAVSGFCEYVIDKCILSVLQAAVDDASEE